MVLIDLWYDYSNCFKNECEMGAKSVFFSCTIVYFWGSLKYTVFKKSKRDIEQQMGLEDWHTNAYIFANSQPIVLKFEIGAN